MNGLTGGLITEQNPDYPIGTEGTSPVMYQIMFNQKPYLNDVKLFRESPDLVMGALVTDTNQILIMNVSNLIDTAKALTQFFCVDCQR